MVDEFFNESEQRLSGRAEPRFQFGDLQNELDVIHQEQMHQQPHAGDWATEFYNPRPEGARLWEIGFEGEAAMEEAFLRSQQTAVGLSSGKFDILFIFYSYSLCTSNSHSAQDNGSLP